MTADLLNLDSLTTAERRVLVLLPIGDQGLTPADIKSAMFPGKPPVATLRAIIGRLIEAGAVETAPKGDPRKPNTTAYRMTTAAAAALAFSRRLALSVASAEEGTGSPEAYRAREAAMWEHGKAQAIVDSRKG